MNYQGRTIYGNTSSSIDYDTKYIFNDSKSMIKTNKNNKTILQPIEKQYTKSIHQVQNHN